ncbi:hypothetical protein BUALT_Bualt09G0093200 [Buddleja alternifolia]|uniref:Bifunctional inhibitor/plant lipid transfer protein/seed storage helical domain-containing protein n=1 Tax=Buddleja alternifolia TaxID=168488 RepID=A0AAV6XBW1_9LAMI|nr:hypothetical protein BUALT_Bualt09G0093200 [Buddleja alternifolia]
MAKNLALTAVLLAALVALATATTYTTTVTTTTFDDSEENPRESQQCRQQVQGRQFQSCQRYLTSRRSGGGQEVELLEMTTDNPRQQEEEQQHLRQCCQQLRNVDQQCRCEAIRHAVRQTQQGGGSYQGEQMQQVYQKARSLPQRCNMRSPRQCEIRAIFV